MYLICFYFQVCICALICMCIFPRTAPSLPFLYLSCHPFHHILSFFLTLFLLSFLLICLYLLHCLSFYSLCVNMAANILLLHCHVTYLMYPPLQFCSEINLVLLYLVIQCLMCSHKTMQPLLLRYLPFSFW